MNTADPTGVTNHLQYIIDGIKEKGLEIGNLGIEGLYSNDIDLSKIDTQT
jgi:hypothetical protein